MNKVKQLYVVGTKFSNALTVRRFSSNLYEPDYLDAMKSKIPLYDTLNIQIKGYDFSILESYQKLIHNIVKNMDINVEECWSIPHQDLQVCTYKPNSEIVNSQYKLKAYQRTVQITDINSLQLPILLRTLETSAPAGVNVSVVQHADYHEEERYVPDKDLINLKQELEGIASSKKK